MYRLIFPLLVCACAVGGAPQHSSDDPAGASSDRQGFGSGPPVAADALEDEQLIRHARQDSISTELGDPDTTETVEAVTEREVIAAPRTSLRPFTRAPRPTRPSARFVSNAKLSYFDKPGAPSAGAANLLDSLPPDKGYRKFTSSCRCEKIWNCARLQITTPRCPDEYFLCCNL